MSDIQPVARFLVEPPVPRDGQAQNFYVVMPMIDESDGPTPAVRELAESIAALQSDRSFEEFAPDYYLEKISSGVMHLAVAEDPDALAESLLGFAQVRLEAPNIQITEITLRRKLLVDRLRGALGALIAPTLDIVTRKEDFSAIQILTRKTTQPGKEAMGQLGFSLLGDTAHSRVKIYEGEILAVTDELDFLGPNILLADPTYNPKVA